jgi:hypothetical protein
MRGLAGVAALAGATLALGAGAASAQTTPLAGPDGTSLNKVLVIGTDGTRWDLLTAAMRAGRAPNLARLRRQGFAEPHLLDYGPGTFTLSEVGWSSVASGVWEDKHGVDGSKFNMDPGQATKNGYLDFLTRIENRRARLSTFLASDWDNIGLAENGGPIFGTAMDANFAARVEEETIEAWDQGDEAVTGEAARYLRRGNPDAGFVYLGFVDETAHLAGSATPTYAEAITTTDRRIGRLLHAIRARRSYPFESWTVLVTTDHGQQPWDYPSVVSHLTDTPLERTSFVLGAGPGLAGRVPEPRVVDVLPTVLRALGLRTPSSWNIDGRSLVRSRPPSSAAVAVRGRPRAKRLVARLRLGAPARGVRAAVLRLPAGLRVIGGAAALRARVNERPADVRVRAGRTLIVRTGGRPLRALVLRSVPGAVRGPGRPPGVVRIALRGRRGSLGSLEVPLAGARGS